MQAEHVGPRAQRIQVRLRLVPVRGGTLQRPRAAPCKHLHAERPAVAGDECPDRSVACDAEHAAVQLPPDRRLPPSRAERDGVCDEAARRPQDQRQRQLGGRVRRAAAVADDDAAACAGIHVDVRHPAAGLADQAQVGKPFEQRRVDRSALADQDERLCVADLRRPLVQGRGPLRVDGDVVAGDEREAVEPLHRPLIVLHHDDAHHASLSRQGSAPAGEAGIPHGCYDSA